MGGDNHVEAPDYTDLAYRQSAADRQAAEQHTLANRPEQRDALGNSISWSRGPNGEWIQQENWSPEILAQHQGQIANTNQAQGVYGGLLNQLQQQGMTGPFQGGSQEVPTFDASSGDAVANAMYEQGMARMRPEQERYNAALENKMRLQGLDPRTDAYSAQMGDTLRTQGQMQNDLNLGSIGQGYNTALNIYNAQLKGQSQDWGQKYKEYTMPWELARQASGMANNVYTPEYQGYSGATGWNAPDLIGAANADYQAELGEEQARQAKNSRFTKAAGAAIGGYFGGPAGAQMGASAGEEMGGWI